MQALNFGCDVPRGVPDEWPGGDGWVDGFQTGAVLKGPGTESFAANFIVSGSEKTGTLWWTNIAMENGHL